MAARLYTYVKITHAALGRGVKIPHLEPLEVIHFWLNVVSLAGR